MESVGNLFISYTDTVQEKSKIKSLRTFLIKELYELYISQPERTQKENRLRYKSWMIQHHPQATKRIGFSKQAYDSYKSEFKKAKLLPLERYIPTFSDKFFAIKMAHLKGEEGIETLQYMISVAKDIGHRDGNVAAYILGSIKVVN